MDQTTLRIAAYLADADWVDFPDDVSRHALRSFVNFSGCAIGGSRHEAVDVAEQSLCFTGEASLSDVIGRPLRAAPMLAALLNGISSSVHAFDDTHAEAVVHPSSPVGSALVGLMGVIPQAITGRQLLSAFTLGIELTCRLSKAISVAPAVGDIGWSQSGITGAVGAAAACGKLFRFDAARMASALGIAASLASGLRVAHGTMTMHLVPAQAAMIGVQATLLARGGFTGPWNGLEGRYGFLNLFAKSPFVDSLATDFGTRYELLFNTFKPYPCGIVVNPVIDICLRLWSEGHYNADEICDVVLTVSDAAGALANRPHPCSEFEAQVSVQHWAAVALLYGVAGLPQISRDVVEGVAVQALRNKCHVVTSSEIEMDSARVQLRLLDGRCLKYEIAHCHGSLLNPMSDQDISSKFLNQSELIIGREIAQTLLETCWSLPLLDDVRRVFTIAAITALL